MVWVKAQDNTLFPSCKASPQYIERMSALSLTYGRQEQPLIDLPKKERLPSLDLVCLERLSTPGHYNHFRNAFHIASARTPLRE